MISVWMGQHRQLCLMRVLELLSCFNPGHLGTVVLDCSVVTDSDAKMSRRIRKKLEMWANAQPDGRPAEYRWRPLFNAAKFG